ncbi:hypothetical protein BGZ63DRAFT_475585 [Mariannaea sp. PMI_226]|nr:hypothetical protein BGZ63DRAFT_475585 [Mariannaea sp. PMI_226]
MSNLLVLSDTAVHEILIGLTRNEILSLQDQLKRSLTALSTGAERQYQPSPSVIRRPNGQETLFRPFTSAEAVGTKIIVHPAPTPDQKSTLHGVLVLCDDRGLPTGVVNAEEVTGIRTALSAMIPFMWRRCAERVVVFGAGKQALWHIRLILALRGAEVTNISIVNRTKETAELLLAKVQEENQLRWKSFAKFECLYPLQSGYEERRDRLVAEADAIFCTVASREPLFRARCIIDKQGRQRLPYIASVGSWQPHMVEIDPMLLKHVVDDCQAFSSDGNACGMILVDDREQALLGSGEIIQSGLTSDQLVEVGEIEGFLHEKSGLLRQRNPEQMQQWLGEGFVIYKSIGVSLTDLVAGNWIVSLAKRRNAGVQVSDF